MQFNFARSLTLISALAGFGYASSAMAFFDAEVLAGKRWYSLEGANGAKDGHIASQEINVAAHIDPIPLVPIAFGASVALGTLKKSDLGPDVTEASTFETNLEIKAWIPMVPVVTPYVRVKVPVVGKYVVKGKVDPLGNGVKQDIAQSATLSGYHLDAGLKYSPLPLIGILFEVGMGQEKLKEDEIKVGGVKLPKDSKSYDLKSQTVQLGVTIGI